VTPPHAGGAASVLVRDPATGQAALAPQEFSFASSGGGGGCSLGTIGGPPSPSEPLAGAGWIVLVLAVLVLRARRAGPRGAGASA
jgi:hypothetical protein